MKTIVKKMIESVINEDVEKACVRLMYLLDMDSLTALFSDKLAVRIIKAPKITTMHQLYDFANSCGKDITLGAKKALDCEVGETSRFIRIFFRLNIEQQYIHIQYDYDCNHDWIKNKPYNPDYDSFTLSIEEAEKAGFEFEYV